MRVTCARGWAWLGLAPMVALALGVLTIPVAEAGFKQINTPNPDDPMKVRIFELDNGLTVYLTENHETPRFYSEIAVRAGSKQDPADATGLAHYLEHLLFKGNTKMGTLDYAKEKPFLDEIQDLYEKHFAEKDDETRKAIYAEINRIAQEAAQYAVPNEIDKLYNGMGSSHVNAHTWHEETVYEVGLPANRLTQWATIESDRYVDPVFRLFHTELETVYEEKNRSIDNKERLIHEAVGELLYKKHPYGQQLTIGTVEHLKRPSLIKIRNFFDTWYVPNNMAISVSGDINIDETIKVIDEAFGKWKRKDIPAPKTWDEAPLKGAERVTVKYLGEEYVLLAYRTAPRGHADYDALRLVDMVMNNTAAGLIDLNLNQQQKVRSAGSSPDFNNDYGAQTLFGIPKDGQTLEEVEKLLVEQLELLKKGEFEDWILPAIITDFKKNEKAQLESDMARAGAMTTAFLSFQDWDHVVGDMGRMEKVTKADVVAVANKYFGDNYVAGFRIDAQQELPQIEKPQIDAVEIDPSRQSEYAKAVLALPVIEIEPVFVDPAKDFKVVEDGKGVKLYYSPNPLNDLFSFSINVEFGTHEDNKIAIATRLMDKSGTDRFAPEDLKKEWYKLGTDFAISAGDNESFVSIAGLDENFEKSLGLMIEVLTKPVAEGAVLDELKKIILAQRTDAKKDPGTVGQALTNYNRYGKDSYFLRMLPEAELNALTVEELHALVRGLLGYKHTLTYTGSLPLEDVLAILKKHHPAQGDLKNPPAYRFLKARTPEKTEIYFYNKEMAQAQVRIDFPDGVYTDANETPIELYNTYFDGGMSGVVFQELREARALAYSAGARYLNGSRKNDENLMIGVIGCQADKTPEAVDAFLDLFDNLPESEDRFREAIGSIVNRYRTSKLGYRAIIGAVRGWEKLGVPIDPRKQRFEAIQKADMNTLLGFHKAHVKGRPKLISIVGDKTKMDMERIAKQGAVVEIGEDQIFVK